MVSAPGVIAPATRVVAMTSALWSLAALVAWVRAARARDCGSWSVATERPVSPVRVLTVALATGLSVWFLGSELLARFDVHDDDRAR